MTDQAELILLSRAEVERHRDELRGDEYAAANDARAGQEAAEACRDAADRLDALLAAARPVVDAGNWTATLTNDGSGFHEQLVRRGPPPDGFKGPYVGDARIFTQPLVFAADAAEEGE